MRSAPQILSLGSINADFEVRAARCPDPGETLLGRDFLLVGGGKAANVALFARRIGVSSVLFGRVGDDALADVALSPLRDAGVALEEVRAAHGATGAALVVVRDDGEKTIVAASNANDRWDEGDADRVADAVSAAPDGSVLVVDLEVPRGVLLAAMRAAKERGFAVVVDPSPADRLCDELLELTDHLTPNASEAKALSGTDISDDDSAARAGQELRARTRGGVVHMKLEDGGSLVVADDVTRIPRLPVEVVDKTGAGDAFAAALAAALVEGHDPVEGALWGVAATHLAVGHYGAQPAYPDRAGLDAMVERLRGARA